MNEFGEEWFVQRWLNLGLDGTSRSNNCWTLLPKAFSSPYSSYCLMLSKFSSKGESRLKLGQHSVCAFQHRVCSDTFVSSSLPSSCSLGVCAEELSRGSVEAVSLAPEIPWVSLEGSGPCPPQTGSSSGWSRRGRREGVDQPCRARAKFTQLGHRLLL